MTPENWHNNNKKLNDSDIRSIIEEIQFDNKELPKPCTIVGLDASAWFKEKLGEGWYNDLVKSGHITEAFR